MLLHVSASGVITGGCWSGPTNRTYELEYKRPGGNKSRPHLTSRKLPLHLHSVWDVSNRNPACGTDAEDLSNELSAVTGVA